MDKERWYQAVLGWVCHLHLVIAYRIVWAGAKLNLGSSRDVYRAMWDANLDLPPIKGLTK